MTMRTPRQLMIQPVHPSLLTRPHSFIFSEYDDNSYDDDASGNGSESSSEDPEISQADTTSSPSSSAADLSSSPTMSPSQFVPASQRPSLQPTFFPMEETESPTLTPTVQSTAADTQSETSLPSADHSSFVISPEEDKDSSPAPTSSTVDLTSSDGPRRSLFTSFLFALLLVVACAVLVNCCCRSTPSILPYLFSLCNCCPGPGAQRSCTPGSMCPLMKTKRAMAGHLKCLSGKLREGFERERQRDRQREREGERERERKRKRQREREREFLERAEGGSFQGERRRRNRIRTIRSRAQGSVRLLSSSTSSGAQACLSIASFLRGAGMARGLKVETKKETRYTLVSYHTSTLSLKMPQNRDRPTPRHQYHTLDSNSSSSSDEDEPLNPTSPFRSLSRQYSKRLFKDSSSNLPHLESSPIFNHGNLHEILPDNLDGTLVNQLNYIELIKIEFFTLGLIIGAALQMFTVSIIIMFVSYSQHSGPLLELSHEYYPVFRCMFFISFFFTLYGGNLFLWRRVKIEYRSVLGVGSSHTYRKRLLSPSISPVLKFFLEYVLRGAASSAIIMFTCFMLYVLTITGGFDSIHIHRDQLKHLWPALAFLVPLFSFFCPYDSITQFYFGNVKRAYEQRTGLVSEIIAVLLSPFSHVTFLRSFIADIFCSMPRVFTDFQYTICIYSTGSFWDVKNEWINNSSMHAYETCGAGSPFYVWIVNLLSFLPYHIRLMQSFRVPLFPSHPMDRLLCTSHPAPSPFSSPRPYHCRCGQTLVIQSISTMLSSISCHSL
jgi:hypothetical protein